MKIDNWNNKFTEREGTAYFVTYNLECLDDLHALHNNYPLGPETSGYQLIVRI